MAVNGLFLSADLTSYLKRVINIWDSFQIKAAFDFPTRQIAVPFFTRIGLIKTQRGLVICLREGQNYCFMGPKFPNNV